MKKRRNEGRMEEGPEEEKEEGEEAGSVPFPLNSWSQV